MRQPARLEQRRDGSAGRGLRSVLVRASLQVLPHHVEEGGISPGRVGVDQPAGVLQVDCEPDQVLLGTVVQLALDAAPIGIGGEYEPLAATRPTPRPRRAGGRAAPPVPRSADPRDSDRLLLDYAGVVRDRAPPASRDQNKAAAAWAGACITRPTLKLHISGGTEVPVQAVSCDLLAGFEACLHRVAEVKPAQTRAFSTSFLMSCTWSRGGWWSGSWP